MNSLGIKNNEFYLAIAGFGSGISQTIIGHPFDTVKVYRQNSLNKKIKFTNLFRGISYPLMTNSLICSINFSSYEYFKNYTSSNIISGGLSGIITGFFINPIEIKKIKKQLFINNHISYTSGLGLCISREVVSYSIYFYTYNKLKEKNLSILNSGGIAGTLSWFFSYPIDVIKTRIQSQKYKTIKSCIIHGKLMNGIIICLLRAYPVNAVGLYSYEWLKNIF